MTPEDANRLMELQAELGAELLGSSGSMRRKPLYGGHFGMTGRYLIGSYLMVEKDLYSVSYYVLEAQTWMTIGNGDSQSAAMEAARRFLLAVDQSQYADFVRNLVHKRALQAEAEEKAAAAALLAQREAWKAQQRQHIPKRRKQIFEASEGKCHYCGLALTLDGKWHIEHKMPKALMGGNEPSNLVASCVPCNHKKRDKTDREFMAECAAA